MPRTCTVCSHKSRQKIDIAIARGDSNRVIASQFGVARASVQRHKRHAAAIIRRATEKRELTIGESVLRDLEKFKLRALKLLDVAEREKNHPACIGYFRELRAMLGAFYEVTTKEAESGRTVGPHPSPCPYCSREEYERIVKEVKIGAIRESLGYTGKLEPIGRLPSPDENEKSNKESWEDEEILPQN